MTVTSTFDEAEAHFDAAADNPALAAAAARLASGSDEAPQPPPTIEVPTDGPVRLPAGFRRTRVTDQGTSFEEVTDAVVRELNGEDEERIAKARLSGHVEDFIVAVLTSGVEALGGSKPTREDFSSLVWGDRDYLLLEIARATYGDKIDYVEFECPHCREEFDISFSLSEDVPVDRLDKFEDRQFEVELTKGKTAKVGLPTCAISREFADAETPAEGNTTLIANAVYEVLGGRNPVTVAGDKDIARKLGLADRQTLVNEMFRRMPGPDYNGIRFSHEPGCGKEVRLSLTLADLFRTL